VKYVAASGITLSLSRLGSAEQTSFEASQTLPGRQGWNPAATGVGRIDGVAKVTGSKVYASDFRAADLPGWPTKTAHAMLIRAPDATHVYAGMDLGRLSGALRPSVVVTAEDIAKIGARAPEFYAGDLFCPVGKTPLYMGQPVALLIFETFDAFDQTRLKLRDGTFVKFGEDTGPITQPNYGAFRFTRVAGPSADAPDVYSPVQEGWVSPGFQNNGRPVWRVLPVAEGAPYVKAATHGERIRAALAANDPGLLVLDREFETQSVDPMFLEPETGLAWFDAGSRNLEIVLGVQSPYEAAESVAHLLGEVQAPFKPARIKSLFTSMSRWLRSSCPAVRSGWHTTAINSFKAASSVMPSRCARESASIARPARSVASPPITCWMAAVSPIFQPASRPSAPPKRSASTIFQRSISPRSRCIRAASPQGQCAATERCR
jgi:hypothetical protein